MCKYSLYNLSIQIPLNQDHYEYSTIHLTFSHNNYTVVHSFSHNFTPV